MRLALVFASFFTSAALVVAAAVPAHAQDKAAKTGTAKAAAPVAVPADVRARVVAKLPGAKPDDVNPSPIPGLYEVTMGGVIVYVSSDGKHLLSGNVYDLDTQVNLTAARRNAARAKALAAVKDDQMIVFGPANSKMTVTIFTDIDCGYCRRFHSQIAEISKAGVRVRYMMFPRTGPGTESWRKAESVWCAKDRRDALTRAKKGEELKTKSCADAESIKDAVGVRRGHGRGGHARHLHADGRLHRRVHDPDQLVQTIQETQKAAAAAR